VLFVARLAICYVAGVAKSGAVRYSFWAGRRFREEGKLASKHLTVAELLSLLEGDGASHALALRMLTHLREVSTSVPDLSPLSQLSPLPRRTPRRRRAARRAALAAERRRAEEIAARLAARLAADRRGAAKDFNHLFNLEAAERGPLIAAARRRFSSPVLVELLIEEASAALRLDLDATAGLLDLAATVAHRVDPWRFGRELVDRLLARVEAHRANTLRVAGDLKGADAIWLALRARLRRHPLRDPAAEAELASLEASLRQIQRRLAEAEELLALAAEAFRAAGDAEGVAKVLIQQGVACFLRGESAAALPLFRQAATAADPERWPRRFLETQHNLAVCLCQLGRNEEAAELLAGCRDLYRRFPEPWTQILLTWIEGRIAAGKGDAGAAERLLLDARNRYLGEGLRLDGALITLDLTEVYLREGRTAEVKRLARATVGVFEGQAVYAEAGRAVALFHQAAAADRLTPELIARLRAYLERARHDPRLPFDPAG